jgi:hypothetical protein
MDLLASSGQFTRQLPTLVAPGSYPANRARTTIGGRSCLNARRSLYLL